MRITDCRTTQKYTHHQAIEQGERKTKSQSPNELNDDSNCRDPAEWESESISDDLEGVVVVFGTVGHHEWNAANARHGQQPTAEHQQRQQHTQQQQQ